MKYIAIIIIINLIIISGCDSPLSPIESDNPSIVYELSGGFAGIFHKLTIDNSGIASYESIYPVLSLQLSDDEFIKIKYYLVNFESYRDSYPGQCIDDFHHKITLKTNYREKTVEFDGCSIDKFPELSRLANLSAEFGKLSIRIYEEKATWEGLNYQFAMDASAYSPSDTIYFSCKITNPTDKERCIYFRNKYRILLSISNNTYEPHIHFWIPDYATAMSDTTSPSKIILPPGNETDIIYSWNQSFVNYNELKYDSLPVGTYSAKIHLLGGFDLYGSHPISDKFTFEIKK